MNSALRSIAASNQFTQKTTTMKFRFTKDAQSISKAEFERNVPTNWINQLDEFGCFSWGYFRATLID